MSGTFYGGWLTLDVNSHAVIIDVPLTYNGYPAGPAQVKITVTQQVAIGGGSVVSGQEDFFIDVINDCLNSEIYTHPMPDINYPVNYGLEWIVI